MVITAINIVNLTFVIIILGGILGMVAGILRIYKSKSYEHLPATLIITFIAGMAVSLTWVAWPIIIPFQYVYNLPLRGIGLKNIQ
jgi:ABC-type antimicrobial peptide transport system permease subunit